MKHAFERDLHGRWWLVQTRQNGSLLRRVDVTEHLEPYLAEFVEKVNRLNHLQVAYAQRGEHLQELKQLLQRNHDQHRHELREARQAWQAEHEQAVETLKMHAAAEMLVQTEVLERALRELELLRAAHAAFLDVAIEDGARAVHEGWCAAMIQRGFHSRMQLPWWSLRFVRPWWHVWCLKCHPRLTNFDNLSENHKEEARSIYGRMRTFFRDFVAGYLRSSS